MLRIAEQWYGSDVGRQRQGNEDNYFVQAPLFVVADGMGGAQAGEVASAMAVEAFRGGVPDGSPERGLVDIIRSANNRIHDMSRSDAQRQGMGTTCTAAYVAEEEVVLAHVGDSRCYLFRDGELTRLTRDHSLVGELIDRGKLTEEQAEVHPQRSVITRALGPEADVQVDTERVAARGGDLFLLCSDGLTSMVREHTILPILQDGGPLPQLGKRLIAAANEAGGRDNITVVLFRLDEVRMAGGTDRTTEQAALAEEPATRVEEVARADPPAAAAEPAATAGDEAEADYRRHGTVALSAVGAGSASEPAAPPRSAAPPRTAPPPRPPESQEKPRRRRRALGPLVAVLGLAAIILVAAFLAMRAVFFIGLDDHRAVTIYRGVPYELPGGIELYTRHYSSGVTLQQVSPQRRGVFTDHKLRSLSDATDLVRQLETGKLGR